MKFNFIDLFCGCGGFSLGFQNAGFNGLIAVDNWQPAIDNYNNNFKHKSINKDIEDINTEELLHLCGADKDSVDIIIGGPPCQGFSLAGKRTLMDKRNRLYKSFVRIVSEIQPKVFVMENVPGLVRLYKGNVIRSVVEEFESEGYYVVYKILSAEEYGVPQTRKRVFIVGLNKNKVKNYKDFMFPQPSHGERNGLLPLVTTKDAIDDLNFSIYDDDANISFNYVKDASNSYQKQMRKNSDRIYNHIITKHNEKTKKIIALVPDGGNYKDLPKEFQGTRKVNIAWTRMNSKKPCFTIDTGHNHHFHYNQNRVPTVRESARIQSFPDRFIFVGKKTDQLKVVGNAVPPLLAEQIAKQIQIILSRG